MIDSSISPYQLLFTVVTELVWVFRQVSASTMSIAHAIILLAHRGTYMGNEPHRSRS